MEIDLNSYWAKYWGFTVDELLFWGWVLLDEPCTHCEGRGRHQAVSTDGISLYSKCLTCNGTGKRVENNE